MASNSTTTVTPVSTRTSKFPVLQIMAGKCNFLVPIGKLTICCPCLEFMGTSKDGQLDIVYQHCLHPLTQHGDSSSAEVYSTQQGSSQLETSFIPCQYLSARSETVSKLADLIDEQKVVHVRGTPATGKTTLARLLEQYFKVQKRNVLYVGTWRKLGEYPSEGQVPYPYAWNNLDTMLRTRFGPMNYLAPGTILIIDEAQGSYSDTLFWNHIIKERLSYGGLDIRFCLFCCYGSPLSGVQQGIDIDVTAFTPAHFNPAQCVTLTPQSHPSSPQIGLFFTRSEFTEASQRLIANPCFQEKFTLHQDAEDYLFSLTNGHPGGLISVLMYIHNFYRRDIKSHDLSERVITKQQVVHSLKWDQDVWDMLAHEPISRSLPDGHQLTKEVADLLAKVLEEGSVPFELNKEAETCYKSGWLHRMQVRREDGHYKDVYVLPSRLHEKWVEHYIAKEAKSLPSEFQNLRDLTLAILQEFSSLNLRHSAQGKTLSSGAQPKPIEAQYQYEFYRCFNKIAGRGVPIYTEWSRTTDGRVDFWIPGQKWAVQIVREQDRINEHIMRFHENGQYYPWRVDGMIQDWIIVNCTTSPPTHEYEETRLIHAVFKKDYAELQILDNQMKILQTSFLHN